MKNIGKKCRRKVVSLSSSGSGRRAIRSFLSSSSLASYPSRAGESCPPAPALWKTFRKASSVRKDGLFRESSVLSSMMASPLYP